MHGEVSLTCSCVLRSFICMRSLEAGMKSCSAGRQVKRRNGLHGNRVRVAHVVYALHGMFKRTQKTPDFLACLRRTCVHAGSSSHAAFFDDSQVFHSLECIYSRVQARSRHYLSGTASAMSAEGRSVLDGTRRVCFRHSRKLVFLVWQSKDLKHDFDTDSDSAVGCNCFLLRVTRHEPGL